MNEVMNHVMILFGWCQDDVMLMLHVEKSARMVQKGATCGADVVHLWQIGNAEARKTEGADGAFVVVQWCKWCLDYIRMVLGLSQPLCQM